jgi:ATP-binding cassette subfamily B protein RtxB
MDGKLIMCVSGKTTVSSALLCCRLLLQLINKPCAGINTAQSLPLKKAITQYSKFNNVRFHLRHFSFSSVDTRQLPLAYENKQGEFVILAKLSDSQALIQSPLSSSPEVITLTELENSWGGSVIELRDSVTRFDIRWFIPAFLKHKRLLGEVLLFSFMLQCLALISPLFFQVVMDKVLVHRALSTLDVLVWVLVIVGLFEVILRGLREYVFSHTTNRIDIVLGVQLFKHVLSLPLPWFKHRAVGNIISRIQELDSVREFLTGSFLTLGVDLVFTVIFLVVMACFSPLLVVIVLLTLPLYVLLAWSGSRTLQARIEHQFQTSALNTSFLNEAVSGAETIKSLAVEPGMQRRQEQQSAEMVEAGFRTQTLNNGINQAVALLQKVTGVAVIWTGAYQVTSLHMTIGQLIAFNMLLSQVNQPVSKFIDLWQQFIQTRVAVDKLGDMLNQPAEQAQDTVSPKTSLQGNIALQQVDFRYRPDLPLVLKDISLHIPAGESLGIVGPSGSGKSTLARLFQKLYVPDNGVLLMDGIPLSQLDTHYLRTQVGVVLQENYLFNRTVRQNIAIQCPSTSLEAVVQAARLAGAHDFILQLPLGYDTVLAEAGRSLSGGQRQRIAIARALITDPRILIFDEATSALDDESQAIIQNNMRAITQGRTVIMIAHRLSTVRQCDRIITLEQGSITESGTHSQLLRAQGCYARLWQLQQALEKETT